MLYSINMDAKYLLALEDGWGDDETATAYPPDHVERASLLAESLCYLAKAPAPIMTPAERDSIDLFWNKDYVGSVLINVPRNGSRATFSCHFFDEQEYGHFDNVHPATVLKFLIKLMGYSA